VTLVSSRVASLGIRLDFHFSPRPTPPKNHRHPPTLYFSPPLSRNTGSSPITTSVIDSHPSWILPGGPSRPAANPLLFPAKTATKGRISTRSFKRAISSARPSRRVLFLVQSSNMLMTGWNRMLRTGRFADASIHCGTKTWHVHTSIVCSRSEYFEKALTSDFEVSFDPEHAVLSSKVCADQRGRRRRE